MMDTQFAVGVAVFVGFILCVVIHECAHALVALWLGDDTAYLRGRLTLNPIPHIDPILSIVLPVALWISGLPIFGGAKGVPVDMNKLRGNRLVSMALVALAGPLSNVLLALGFALMMNAIPTLIEWDRQIGERIWAVLTHLVLLNVILVVFNMVPIPPLDGSRILAACLPGRSGLIIYELERFGMLLVALFVFSGGSRLLLSWPMIQGAEWLIQATAFGAWSGPVLDHGSARAQNWFRPLLPPGQ